MAFLVGYSVEGLRELAEGCDTHCENELQAKEAGQHLPKEEGHSQGRWKGGAVSNEASAVPSVWSQEGLPAHCQHMTISTK